MKFHDVPPNGSGADACMQTDVTKLTGAYNDCFQASTKECVPLH